MRKILTAFAVFSVAMVAMAGIAAADTMTVDPETVDAAGEHDIEVSVSGFTGGISLFALPCDYPESGDAEDIDVTTCDQAQLTPIAVGDDGTATVTVTLDIPEGGIAIIAGDADRTESARAVVAVEAPVELAATGLGTTTLLTMIGLAMLAVGAAGIAVGRRFQLS